MNRDHRLDFEDILRAPAFAVRAVIEGGVVVERDADEVGDRVSVCLARFASASDAGPAGAGSAAFVCRARQALT